MVNTIKTVMEGSSPVLCVNPIDIDYLGSANEKDMIDQEEYKTRTSPKNPFNILTPRGNKKKKPKYRDDEDLEVSSENKVAKKRKSSATSLSLNNVLSNSYKASKKGKKTSPTNKNPIYHIKGSSKNKSMRKSYSEGKMASKVTNRENIIELQSDVRLLTQRIDDLEESHDKLSSTVFGVYGLMPINLDNIEYYDIIGDGSSEAKVYKCCVDGWRCVVKKIDKKMCSPRGKDVLRDELNLLYQLPKHPNIINYLFHKDMGNELCLFMTEYDMTLNQEILRRKETDRHFGRRRIILICKEICKGMAFLHENNIIHRDLKSHNIFINLRGKIVTDVVVGDFDVSMNSIKRRPVSCIGTPGYIAPEVLQASVCNPYDEKSDVFSFGMILYELMTLDPPYKSKKNAFMISKAILNGDKPHIDDDISDMYDELVDLHLICIETNPSLRFSFAEILEQLENLEE